MSLRIGVMGGSFNPVHIGHLMVADYVRQHACLDRVIMMLSPQNPLKCATGNLIDDKHRLAMLRIACENADGISASDIELSLPRPSYTITTLRYLQCNYPDWSPKLIIGSDNWLVFSKWRNADDIISDFGVIVYPRPGYEIAGNMPAGVELIEAPTVNVSSTFIRSQIAAGYNMKTFLPVGVDGYIKENKLYRNLS